MNFDFNCYVVLGVKDQFTDKELHKAYRDLSKKYHPDNIETGDEELFKKIGIAYAILSNPKKRKLYDLGKWDDLEPENEINLSDAEQNIIALFQKELENSHHVVEIGLRELGDFLKDIVKNIKKDLMKAIMDYEHDQLDLEDSINLLRELKEKVIFNGKKTKNNLMKMAITQAITLKEGEIADIKREKLLSEEMLDLLDDFLTKIKHVKLLDGITIKDRNVALLNIESSF